jgi:hypothetical protein
MEIGERTPLLSVRSSQRRVQSRQTRRQPQPSATTTSHYPHRRRVAAPPSTSTIDDDDDDDDEEEEKDDTTSTTTTTGFRCGTDEQAGIWWSDDLSGSFLAVAVWISYGCVMSTIVARTQHVNLTATMCTTGALALAAHAKTALTDPGTVPRRAVVRHTNAYCALCQAGKPILAHHCRTCRRCICRMDHHCPWVKNCTFGLSCRVVSVVVVVVFVFVNSGTSCWSHFLLNQIVPPTHPTYYRYRRGQHETLLFIPCLHVGIDYTRSYRIRLSRILDWFTLCHLWLIVCHVHFVAHGHIDPDRFGRY